MSGMNRREFIQVAGVLATAMGLGEAAVPRLAVAAEELTLGTNPVLWLQAQACSGCSVSFLNSDDPGPAEVLTRYINLLFHSTVSTATGEVAMGVVNGSIAQGGFFLVVEGALPEKMDEACIMGHEPLTKLVAAAAAKAKAIITLGACACFGGVPGAEGNPTGAISAFDFIRKQGIKTPMIRVPGCPAHPDWLVGTLAHVLGFGLPELDKLARPTMFYGRTLHEQCPRYADYEREKFARTFGESGCLFLLGCQGPLTHSDCSLRLWNSRTNFCINAGAPCIGCSSEFFAQAAEFPFYVKNPAMQMSIFRSKG